MIGAINNGLGLGNAWGQIKKTVETAVETVAPPAPVTPPASNPNPPPSVTEPTGSTQPFAPAQTVNPPVASEPLTYSAPSSGPRQVSANANMPVALLGDRLADAGYYASPQAAAVADPVASAQREKDGAALTQAQIIAQAAYDIVARAGADDRLSLIQNG